MIKAAPTAENFKAAWLVVWDLLLDEARVIASHASNGHFQSRLEFCPNGRSLAVSGEAVELFDWNEVRHTWANLRLTTLGIIPVEA